MSHTTPRHNAGVRRAASALALGVLLGALGVGAASAAPVTEIRRAEVIELAYDAAGALHLVGRIAGGPPNELVHQSMPPGGTFSAQVPLAADFAIAGPAIELVPHPDGSLCLFFDGWRVATDLTTVGLYQRCLRNGAWDAAVAVDVSRGVTATFDADFAPDGAARAIFARPTRSIGFGETELWNGDVDAGWPRLAIDGRGTYHAAFGAFTDPFSIQTSRSTDGGATWSPPEPLSGEAGAAVPFDLVPGREDQVHLLIPGSPSVYRRWANGAWGAPVSLETGFGPKRLTVGPDGNAVVGWASETQVDVFRQRGDGSWSEPTTVQALTAVPERLALAVDAAGNVAVAWSDANGGGIAAAGDERFAASVPSPFDITLDPVILAQSAALAGGVLLLMPLPAQLFNNTLETHGSEISGWLSRLRRRLSGGRGARLAGFWRRPLGIAAFFALAAVISAFLDPGLSLSVESAATVAGLLAGLVVVSIGFQIPRILLHRARSHGRSLVEVLPFALPIAVVSVVISRLTSFEPGYLYGILAGVTLVGAVRPGDGVRGITFASLWTLALCLVAWFALVPVREAAAGAPSLVLVGAEAALATVVTSGLESLVFGLLPLSIGPGGALFREARRTWAVLLGVSIFAFFHVLVNPTSGYLVDSSRIPLLTTVALLVGFSALTALTWAFFRFRPRGVSGPAP